LYQSWPTSDNAFSENPLTANFSGYSGTTGTAARAGARYLFQSVSREIHMIADSEDSDFGEMAIAAP
jgi:hypothetical protein